MDTHEAGGVRDRSDSCRNSNWTGCLQAAGYQKTRSRDIKVKVKCWVLLLRRSCEPKEIDYFLTEK